MDDALSAEHLRALAFASIPGTSQRSHCWVRPADKEEGELSSDAEEIELSTASLARDFKRKLSGGKKKRKKKKGAGVQNLRAATAAAIGQIPVYRAPATTVLTKQATKVVNLPEQSTNLVEQTASLEQVTNLVAQSTDSQALLAQVTNTAAAFPKQAAQIAVAPTKNQLVLKDRNGLRMGTSTKPPSASAQLANGKTTYKVSDNGGDNPFLIKFSDDESDGEIDLPPKVVPTGPVSSKPANLSVEIDRMKKQIAAIERVKGKSLPTGKSIRPNQIRQGSSAAAPKTTNAGTQTSVEVLKKQIAFKESELQQQRHRKDILPSIPNNFSPVRAANIASDLDAAINVSSSPVNGTCPPSQQILSTSEPPSNTKQLITENAQVLADNAGIKRGACQENEDTNTKRQKLAPSIENTIATVDPKDLPPKTDSAARDLAIRDLPMQPMPSGNRSGEAAAAASLVELPISAPKRNRSGDVAVEELKMEEEKIDNELESAQHHRHMCEIRERLARKAYRESQLALKMANTNCERLGQQRDLVSFKVRAAEMRYPILDGDVILRPMSSAAATGIEAAKIDAAAVSHEPRHGSAMPLLDQAEASAIPLLDQADASAIPLLDRADASKDAILPVVDHPETLREVPEPVLAIEAEIKDLETEDVAKRDIATVLDAVTEDSAEFYNELPIDDIPKALTPPTEEKPQEASASAVEEEDLQGSSSSASELKNRKDQIDHDGVGNDLETSGRDPATTQSVLNPDDDNGLVNRALGQGSSPESSADTVMEVLEEADLSLDKTENRPIEVPLQQGSKALARLQAGRLIVFRQFGSNSTLCGIRVPGSRRIVEADSEPYGDYVSALKQSALSKAVDPFQPLCKFEHRGKCNNELCGFQHFNQHKIIEADQDLGQERIDSTTTKSRCSWMQFAVPVPTYRIAGYLMRDPQEINRTRCFNISPVASISSAYAFLATISAQRPLPQDMPCLLDEGSKISNDNFDFIQAELVNGKNMLSRESSADGCLDLALNILKYDVNLESSNCLKNALCVLSRALEVNQTSIPLWVVYLALVSMEDSMSKKDDVLLHAVRLNKYSYDLWCLFLANRSNLADLLESFDTAIMSLCEGNKLTEDGQQNSSCILDLVLRLFYTLAMSGNDVGKWIGDLVAAGSQSSSAIWKNLEPTEACILWICCGYFSAYGMLPDAVISGLGCKQNLPLGLEWESPREISEDIRSRVVQMMKSASSFLDSAGSGDDLPKEALAVNFIRFLVAFEDLEYASSYSLQALQLHPCSIELVVLAANIQRLRGDCKSGLGIFQKGLSSWPSKRPGIQILWNQYAGYALEWEGEESALIILQQNSSSAESRNDQIESAEDSTFALVNLALMEFLRGKQHESQLALEKALASAEGSTHCWLEYAAFKLSRSGSRDFYSTFASILDRCHLQSQLAAKLIPLGRSFLKSIKKRRVRSFIDSLLGPAPIDYSFVNSLLRMCFGSGLLPAGQQKACLHFGGGVLELFPSNSALAMAFCKAIGGSSPATSAWAASILVTSLRQSVSPESLWLDAGSWLEQVGLGDCCQSFYTNALAAYPFSAALWRRYISHSGNRDAAAEAARRAGLTL